MTDEELEALADAYEPEAPKQTKPTKDLSELTDADLEALADSFQPEPKEKGPLAKAFDAYAKKANELGNSIAEGFSDFKREIGPLFKALEPAKPVFDTALRGADIALDTLNRATGTVAGTALDAFINPTQNPEIFSFAQKAQKRIAEQEANGTQEYPILDKVLPIRLAEDVAYPIGESIFKHIANALRLTGNEKAEDIAYVVDGFAPGAGLTASFLMSANIPFPKFGALTKAGIEAEKTGSLAVGVAKQMQQGQRGLIGFEAGGFLLPKKELFNVGGKSAAKTFDKINNLVTKAEVAELFIPGTQIQLPNPLRAVGKVLTKSSHEGINRAVENFNMAKNALIYDADELYRGLSLKASSLGVDISDEVARKTFYRYLDNPSGFAKDPNFKKYERLFNYLDDTLKQEVEKTRNAGIPVPTKVFESLGEGYSERYVPRTAALTKRQELLAKKKLKELEDVDNYVAQLADGKYGSKKIGSFQKNRSELNREAINKLIKEKYDIDDFFHDDFVGAYTDKITELRRARIEKEFFDSIVKTFGKNEAEYLDIIRAARERVRTARANGIVPSSDDVFLASLNARGLNRLEKLPEPVRKRLAQIGALTDKGEIGFAGKTAEGKTILARRKSQNMWDIENIKLPEEIASYITDVLYKPNHSEVMQGLLSYQHAMKGFMFFNPGYHMRNMAESFSRALGYGAGPLEHAKSTAALLRNKGEYVPFLDEFKRLSSNTGFFSFTDEAGEAMRGTINVPRGYLNQQNGQKLLGSALKEIVYKGAWKDFLADLRKNKANIRDNPLFKFSSMVGVQGENISKFAVFSEFRKSGYTAEEAMRKVNKIFPDYQITRSGVRKAQLIFPFANYFIKNAETTLKILAEAPRGAVVMGPQGALQRAFENWAGFDPERTYRYKEIMGDWADDYILLPVMPTAENMDKNPDLIKKALAWWHEGLEPGDVIWARLPSNLHALKQLDPRKLHENWGPVARAASAFFGRDPFTGNPIIGKGTSEQQNERNDAALKELLGPMIPQTAIPAIQELMDKKFSHWRENLLNAGFDEDKVDIIFGSRLDNKKEKARRALAKLRMFWVGGATQIDLQALLGATARMKDAREYVKDVFREIDSGKRNEKEENRALDELDRAYDDIIKLFDVNEEFQDAIDRAGGVPDMRFNYILKDEIPEPEPLLPDIPDDDSDLDKAQYDSYLEDLAEGREPQGSFTGSSLFDVASSTTRRMMLPLVQSEKNIDVASEIDSSLSAPLEEGTIPTESSEIIEPVDEPSLQGEESTADDIGPTDQAYLPKEMWYHSQMYPTLKEEGDRIPQSVDPVDEAIAKVRDFEIEQSILANSDLSTPEGAREAFNRLVDFFKKRIEFEYKDKSPQFKQDLLDTIIEDFYNANRYIMYGNPTRRVAGGGAPSVEADDRFTSKSKLEPTLKKSKYRIFSLEGNK